jgi:protein SCO1/2
MNKICKFSIYLFLIGIPAILSGQDHSGHERQQTPINTSDSVMPLFELEDNDGNTVTMENFTGKYVLLTFGFTRCAHICPMIAANMSRVLKSETGSDTVGIFISVDTERDTAKTTHDYASGFHKNMLGLSGSYEQINKAAHNFKVSYSVTKTQNNYTVQHTTNIFLINPEGDLVEIFAMNSPIDTITSAIH